MAENPLHDENENFDRLIRATFRPQQSPRSATPRVADLYCGDGAIHRIAREAGMEVTYAHDMAAEARDQYATATGLVPDDRGTKINFDDIPAFELVIARLPEEDAEGAFNFVLRFLRVRRPDAFIVIPASDDRELLEFIVRRTDGLGYGIAKGADAILGVWATEDTAIVGILYLEPSELRALATEPVTVDSDEALIRGLLQQMGPVLWPGQG